LTFSPSTSPSIRPCPPPHRPHRHLSRTTGPACHARTTSITRPPSVSLAVGFSFAHNERSATHEGHVGAKAATERNSVAGCVRQRQLGDKQKEEEGRPEAYHHDRGSRVRASCFLPRCNHRPMPWLVFAPSREGRISVPRVGFAGSGSLNLANSSLRSACLSEVAGCSSRAMGPMSLGTYGGERQLLHTPCARAV
jgi:hypothetical protein